MGVVAVGNDADLDAASGDAVKLGRDLRTNPTATPPTKQLIARKHPVPAPDGEDDSEFVKARKPND
jgi:hypothetical protein